MAAWWPNTGGRMTGGFFAIFKFVALNMALSLLGKFRGRKMTLQPPINFPNFSFLDELQMWHPWSHQKLLLNE